MRQRGSDGIVTYCVFLFLRSILLYLLEAKLVSETEVTMRRADAIVGPAPDVGCVIRAVDRGVLSIVKIVIV